MRRRAAVAVIAVALVLVFSAATDRSTRRSPRVCAAATWTTVASVDAAVATRIYRNELAGSEVSADLAHVQATRGLAAAAAAGNRAAALRSVQALVFHPHWHIVRLRVLDRRGRLLADVGGPFVIAPVRGVLRSGGRTVGSFLMSVQDDVGEAKLVQRFIGNASGFYVAGRLVAEWGASFPASEPSASSLILAGRRYLLARQTFAAFPSGALDELQLIAPPPAALSRSTCASVEAGAYGAVAVRFARLATSLARAYYGYAATVTLYTGALVFVRSGTQQLASSGGPGPTSLPRSGAVSYRGRTWLDYSFAPEEAARIYVLAPAS
ncbi:MAG TPA: hypothetical protein VHX66_01120 [Solirubrobacteraceae bacterium]|jgi:hypothetical protein|nr:hypothetical protein [Solirubrobacteraceae bacterium]